MRRIAPLVASLLSVLLADLAGATFPFGVHRRAHGRWTLVAVSVPVAGYTACVMDPPSRKPGSIPGGDGMRGLQARRSAGHRFLRADGDSPAAALDALFRGLPAPASAFPASGLDEIDRHLLYLAGARSAELLGDSAGATPASPILLLAGVERASELMARLVERCDALPEPEGAPTAENPPAPAAHGWWRHLDLPGLEPALALGLRLPGGLSLEDPAMRVALRALHHRLRARLGSLLRVQRVDSQDGVIFWAGWRAPADSLPAYRDAFKSILAELRRDGVGQEELNAHVAFFKDVDERGPQGADRWFEDIFLGEVVGRPPHALLERSKGWEDLGRSAVHDRMLAFFAADPVAVSAGPLAEESLVAGEGVGPTERWRARSMDVESLSSGERTELASAALRRVERALWRGAPPESVSVVARCALAREGSPLTGRVVEKLVFRRGIRREFAPTGAPVLVDTWTSDVDEGAVAFGARRDLRPEERRELRRRFRLDPWCAIRFGAEAELSYLGAVHDDGRVSQGVTIARGVDTLLVRIDPEQATPTSTAMQSTLEPAAEIRCMDYVTWNARRYPRRLECVEGGRRTAVFDVEAVAEAGRLAGSGTLE